MADINDSKASHGIYSILDNKWIKKPQKENIEIDDFEKKCRIEYVDFHPPQL